MFNLFKKHCQICGVEVKKEKAINIFGVYLCSEGHAEEYRKQVKKENANRKGGCC